MYLSIMPQMLQEHWCIHGMHSPFSLEIRFIITHSLRMHTHMHDGEKGRRNLKVLEGTYSYVAWNGIFSASLSLALPLFFCFLSRSCCFIHLESTDYTVDVKENGDPYVCRVTYSDQDHTRCTHLHFDA